MGLIKNNTDLDEIRENISSLESISAEIKAAVADVKTDIGGVKIDVDGVQTDVDTVGTDLTTVKNNIGTPEDGKTVVTMLDEITQSSGGEEILFFPSNNNILISKKMSYTSSKTEESPLLIDGKPLYIFVFGTGSITINVTGYTSYNNTTTLNVYDKGTDLKLKSVQFVTSTPATKSIEIDVYKGLTISFTVESRGPYLNISKMELLATIEKVDMNKALAFNI